MIIKELFEDEQTALPENVILAFEELGKLQRFRPEYAMLDVQRAMGSGILSSVVEHCGDILHRMTHHVRYGSVYGLEKIQKVYKWLSNEYGFEREFRENILANAKYQHKEPDQLYENISKALKKYAEEFEKLPVYNEVQALAKQACIAIGLQNFDKAREALKKLNILCPTQEEYEKQALKYELDGLGNLKEYLETR